MQASRSQQQLTVSPGPPPLIVSLQSDVAVHVYDGQSTVVSFPCVSTDAYSGCPIYSLFIAEASDKAYPEPLYL